MCCSYEGTCFNVPGEGYFGYGVPQLTTEEHSMSAKEYWGWI
jgi:hypothetical protein